MATTAPTKERILFVGHQTIDFQLMESHLRQFGIVCECARTSSEALDALDAGGFDFVILDDTIPEHSALALLAELGRDWPSLKLIVMCGNELGNIGRHIDRSDVINPVATLTKPLFLLQLDQLLLSYRSSNYAVAN